MAAAPLAALLLASLVAGVLGAPPPAALLMPRLLRLSFGDYAGELVAMWSTGVPTQASCAQLLLVQPDVSPGADEMPPAAALGRRAAAGQPWQATCRSPSRLALEAVNGGGGASTVCGGSSSPFVEPATNTTTQYLHRVALGPLEPGAAYRYRVGSPGEAWSGWVALTGPRAPHQFGEQAPASLLVVGDVGYLHSETLPDLIAEVEGGKVDAVLHVGDIAYDLESLRGRRGSQFLARVEPLASRLPYMVLPGNHEVHWNFSHFRELFAMPNRALGENFFYSFEVGTLHVLAYNTEVLYWPESFGLASMQRMYEWMDRDLQVANLNRQRAPWILVAGHRPMYCVAAQGTACDWGWSRDHEASRLGIPSTCSRRHPVFCPPTRTGHGQRFPLEELLHKHGVDIAVFGHDHFYARYHPVFNLSVVWPEGGGSGSANESYVYVNPKATVHVVSGAGGNPEMKRGPEPPASGPCNHMAPWCAFQSGYAPQGQQSADFSYSRVRAINASHLLWEQYSSTLGQVVDSWWLVQHTHGPFPPVQPRPAPVGLGRGAAASGQSATAR